MLINIMGMQGQHSLNRLFGKSSADLTSRLAEILEQFGATEAQELRGARIFALAPLAGELAVEAGILPWKKGEAAAAAKTIFTRWHDARAINTLGSIQRRVLDMIAAFINAHGESRFSPLDEEAYDNQPKTINRAGYWKDEGGARLYLFTSAALKEATKGIDFDQVLSVLDGTASALARKDGKSKSFPARTPRDGLQRFYWIDPSKLNP
jgi:putative DNA primase/helicase